MSLFTRLKNAFNVFKNQEDTNGYYQRPAGMVSSYRPDRPRLSYGNERSIVSAVLTRISVDASETILNVVKTNEDGQYMETVKNSGLNNILTVEANLDQAATAFKREIFLKLLDKGCVAIVPDNTDVDPKYTEGYDILTMRTGEVLNWYPDKVMVRLYNSLTGVHEDVILPKEMVSIVENPFYPVMNEPNSTLKRLINKLVMLDVVDEQTSSGKLDIIIQLPYVTKSDARQAQAERRRSDIEKQLVGSKYGIAYIDGTEHITQLNRPAENNLLSQIEYLTSLLFSQLGITKEIMEGTASEEVMNNYHERTIGPLVNAVCEELTRKHLSKTSRTQGKKVMAISDVFKYVPTSKLPDLADKLTRNEILSSNEIRAAMGYKPSDDPKADQLINSNINQGNNAQPVNEENSETEEVNKEGVDSDVT